MSSQSHGKSSIGERGQERSRHMRKKQQKQTEKVGRGARNTEMKKPGSRNPWSRVQLECATENRSLNKVDYMLEWTARWSSSKCPLFPQEGIWWSLSAIWLHVFLGSTVNNFLFPLMLKKTPRFVLPHWPNQNISLLLLFFLSHVISELYRKFLDKAVLKQSRLSISSCSQLPLLPQGETSFSLKNLGYNGYSLRRSR